MQRETEFLRSLMTKKLIAREALLHASQQRRRTGADLVSQLVFSKMIDETALAKALSDFFGRIAVDLDKVELDGRLLKKIPRSLMTDKLIVPLRFRQTDHGGHLIVVMADPDDLETIQAIAIAAEARVTALVAPAIAIQRLLIKIAHHPGLLDAPPTQPKATRQGEGISWPKPMPSSPRRSADTDQSLVRDTVFVRTACERLKLSELEARKVLALVHQCYRLEAA